MKTSKILIFVTMLAILLFVAACNSSTVPANVDGSNNETLYNSSLNNDLENLATPEPEPVNLSLLTIERRPDAKYEIALDDVFTLSNGSVNSSEISVLGVMLGDSYSDVLATRGIPDVTFIAPDQSYKNMEYSKKIGIKATQTAVTYHIENNTVTRISMRRSFKPYMQGNTTFGTEKEYLYAVFDLPDYTDFTSTYRILNYVSKGFEFYTFRDKLDILSLTPAKKFKGVKYVTVREQISDMVWVNTTKPVLIE